LARVITLAFFAAALIWGGAPALAEGAVLCRPSAALAGPPQDVRAVASLLESHGVSLDTPACSDRVVTASLSPMPGGTGLSVRIVDAFGRSSARHVESARSAANLIESWVLELDEGLILPRPLPAELAPAPAPPVIVAGIPRGDVAVGAWRLFAALEISTATDGSAWDGVTSTGCWLVGMTCLGARLRAGQDARIAGPATDGGMTRRGADLVFIAALPTNRGRATIIPIVGVGPSWTRTLQSGDRGDQPGSVVDVDLSLDVSVEVSMPISHRFALTTELGLTMATITGRVYGAGATSSLPEAPDGRLRVAFGCQYAP
jgi:hypothetical protein